MSRGSDNDEKKRSGLLTRGASLAILCAVVTASLVAGAEGGLVQDSLYFVTDSAKWLLGLEQSGPPNKVETKNAPGIEVVNFAQPGLPKVRMGARVMDLVHGLHFDDILMDTPDEMRPPAAVVFYNSNDQECKNRYNDLKWDSIAEKKMPARERLFAARYDMYSAPRRAWYKFVPELDLAKRFNVKTCPELVFVPRSCDGFVEWCKRDEIDGVSYMGCEDFKDNCTGFESWDGSGDMTKWILDRIDREGEPQISGFLQSYEEQGVWIRKRDHTSSDNHLRNLYLAEAFPAFSKTGFKVMPIPKPFNDWMLEFYERNVKTKRTEFWDSGSTQMSFVEIPTSFIDLDRERHMKEKYANEYLKPIVEEWSGVAPLELTSFYGMREYPNGSFLKNHVDRIDTHVLSVTMTVKKLDHEAAAAKPWPLEVVQWTGDHVRYDHPEGTMILYESSKLPHGRPYRNQGGPHIGAFCHFKPVNMHGIDAAKWDNIASSARRNQAMHTQNVQYRSTKSVEPETPVFTKTAYAKGSKWTHLDGAGDSNESFSVTFKNKSPRMLDLYWESTDGQVVHQGTFAPGTSSSINTFQGHKFFWAEKGSTKPLPSGYMTAEMGRSDYSYAV
mmetsp:Transcript_22112/g.39213  ORF Transcript_22112/g.39213 Transcript_22112/m.39213 type:complete len:613 (-) Transcript_22112:70-1908(-)